ncbi:MAG TPA: hypothetical protein VFI54_18840 [Solirubrobacteraceae bacterium]|nr:hypothetical protein [Solirubrobacteraceae bacterium]
MRVHRIVALLLLIGALLVAGCGSSSSSSSTTQSSSGSGTSGSSTTSSSGSQAQLGFEGIPIQTGAAVAPASTTQTGTVNGIQCGSKEELAYHIHAHLTVFDNGQARSLPGGIGIPGSQVVQTTEGPVASGGQCIYWLHTHAPDGVIHIESPTQRIYSLGDFFDEWHQPLSANQVGDVKGKVSALVDGKPWTKDVRAIPLDPHAVIQLNVGSPVPFETVNWSGTGL